MAKASASSGNALLFAPDTKLIRLFLDWLNKFEEQHAKNWGLLYKDNPEAAMCEATFWGILRDCGVDVEPNADLQSGQKAPDFRCRKNGFEFFFEVTCIGIQTAIKRTGLPHPPEPGTWNYSLLNGTISHACIYKTPQCASVNAPCLLGVGTFHSDASASCVSKKAMEWLLTGEQSIGFDFDPKLGQAVGDPYSVTDLRCASFFNRLRDDSAPQTARSPISAVLVGGFITPPEIYGVLHPDPIHTFDRTALDRIEFCRLLPGYDSRDMQTEWI